MLDPPFHTTRPWLRHVLLWFTVVLLTGCGRSGPFTQPPPRASLQVPQPNLEAVLWWFPEDTETFVAVPGPHTWPVYQTLPEASPAHVMLALTLASLRSLHSGQPFEALQGTTLRLAIHGARRFQPPRHPSSPTHPHTLGLYEGAQVLVFEDPFPDHVWALLNDYARQRGRVTGMDVIRVDETLSGQPWRFWLARPSPHVLVIATDDAFLATVLTRRADPEGPRALNNAEVWALVSSTTQAWAVRQSRDGEGRIVCLETPRGLLVYDLGSTDAALFDGRQRRSQPPMTEQDPTPSGTRFELPSPLSPVTIVTLLRVLGHRW